MSHTIYLINMLHVRYIEWGFLNCIYDGCSSHWFLVIRAPLTMTWEAAGILYWVVTCDIGTRNLSTLYFSILVTSAHLAWIIGRTESLAHLQNFLTVPTLQCGTNRTTFSCQSGWVRAVHWRTLDWRAVHISILQLASWGNLHFDFFKR